MLFVMSAECRDDQFECATGRCIEAAFYYCDGVDDCGDSSDEPPDCCELFLFVFFAIFDTILGSESYVWTMM